MGWYKTEAELSESSRERGLRYLFHDGLASHAMTLLVTGAFLPGMALALGAGNFVIGLLGSLAPISQMAQIPAIFIVERVGLRKLITVIFAVLSRIALVAAATLPFLMPEGWGAHVFLLCMVLFFLAGSVAGCAWNSWIKDLVPEKGRGSYLAKRLSAATAIGALLTVVAGFGIDTLNAFTGAEALSYGLIFIIAAAIGFYGVYALACVPEPTMQRGEQSASWMLTLFEPLRDPNFRKLLAFSASWSFTVIMAGAFMAVYMLKRIGLPMGTVILLAVLSQIINIYFFKLWGALADRFSNKSVLAVCIPMFIVVILLYPFTTMPERYALTIPLLVLIHILGGVSTAGFNLCSANIALRLAPQGKATAYLGANAFISGLSATVAPVVGGLIGAYFATREISMNLYYTPDISVTEEVMSIPAMSFRGIDFIFFAAALVGFYALHRLTLVEEEGTVHEAAVREQVYNSLRSSMGTAMGMSMGMRRMSAFPYELLKKGAINPSYNLYTDTRRSLNRLRRRPEQEED